MKMIRGKMETKTVTAEGGIGAATATATVVEAAIVEGAEIATVTDDGANDQSPLDDGLLPQILWN